MREGWRVIGARAGGALGTSQLRNAPLGLLVIQSSRSEEPEKEQIVDRRSCCGRSPGRGFIRGDRAGGVGLYAYFGAGHVH